MLADVEIYFNVNINMYSLEEDKTATVVRISNLDHKSVPHLNKYENHFSYIKKFKSYAKKYIELGLVVTNVELFIAYNGKAVFEDFMNEVVRDRRCADLGGDEFKMKGEATKTKGNCGYGRTKHTKLSVTKRKNHSNHVNNPMLKHYERRHDMPMQIGK